VVLVRILNGTLSRGVRTGRMIKKCSGAMKEEKSYGVGRNYLKGAGLPRLPCSVIQKERERRNIFRHKQKKTPKK